MSIEYRFDSATLSEVRLSDGFLRAKVRLTKPGVYPYQKPDGTISKEAKLPSDVYSDEFIKSLDGLPVTDGHPYEQGGFVNSENYKSLVKGIIINPRIEDEFVVADEIVFDPELIQDIKANRKVEVSLGVQASYTGSGVFAGNRYDQAQTNLQGNHVAHVVKGRVGPETRILLDGFSYAIQGDAMAETNVTPESEPSWVKKILDGFEKMISLFKPVEPVQDSKVEPKTEAPKNPEQEKQISELKTLIKDLSVQLGLRMDEANHREVLLDQVKAVLPNESLKGISNVEIKKKLISKEFPNVKLDSDDLVDVYYNASLELAKEKAKLNPKVNSTMVQDSAINIEKLKEKRLNLYVEAK